MQPDNKADSENDSHPKRINASTFNSGNHTISEPSMKFDSIVEPPKDIAERKRSPLAVQSKSFKGLTAL